MAKTFHVWVNKAGSVQCERCGVISDPIHDPEFARAVAIAHRCRDMPSKKTR